MRYPDAFSNVALCVCVVHNAIKSPSLVLGAMGSAQGLEGTVASAGVCREGPCPRPNPDQQERRWHLHSGVREEEDVEHLRGGSNSQNHPLLQP